VEYVHVGHIASTVFMSYLDIPSRRWVVHIGQMTGMPNNIRVLREARGWSMEELASALDPPTTAPTINKLEKGQRRLTDDWMRRIASALHCRPADLLADESATDGGKLQTNTTVVAPDHRGDNVKLNARLPQDVPVYGTAAGNVASAVQLIEGDVVDRVRRPPGIMGAPNVYALYVDGDSMSPRFEPGELIYVHPDRKCRPGDYVVVQVRYGDGEPIQTFVKRLKRRTQRFLVLEQYNPPDGQMKVDAASVVAMHRILTMNELFGV